MFDAHSFRRLLSGESRGLAPACARAGLALAEVPYALAMRLRNWKYNLRPGERVAVPVVSVGNLTTGGTGKTPLVAWLALWFRQRGVRVSLVSRGYGAEAGGANDEALELERLLPDVPHVQNADRIAAAQLAIDELATQLILLDDAFQHRRLARDLDLVLLDALEPFGYGHVLPRGLLREPLTGLARAQAVVLSRAALVTPERREEIQRTAARYAPAALWLEGSHAPQFWHNASGQQLPLESPPAGRVAGFCGLGNPAGFRRTLSDLGIEPCLWREFPDHHRYTRHDLHSLAAAAHAAGANGLVCTAKDHVKIAVDHVAGLPLWALRIGWKFSVGEAALAAKLQTLVAAIPPDNEPCATTA